MNVFDFYINYPALGLNGLVSPPDNWADLETELSFENDSPAPVLNAKKLIWSGSVASAFNKILVSGTNISVFNTHGIMEGVPLVIKMCTSQKVVFDGIIDLTEPDTKWACDRVTVTLRDKRMDMVTQLFNSVSCAYLATPVTNGGPGIIDARPEFLGGDYVVIPYQKSSVPDYLEAMLMATAIFNTVVQIVQGIETLNTLISAAISDSTPPAVVTAFNVGIGAWVVATLWSIYLLFLTLWAIVLTKNMFDYLVSPVLTKFGFRPKVILQKICAYFNLEFASTILLDDPIYNRIIIMPRKTAWVTNENFTNTLLSSMNLSVPGGAGTSAFGSFGVIDTQRMEFDDLYNWTHNQTAGSLAAYGYYDGTPAQLLQSLGELFNAKAKILYNNAGQPVLHFERWDYFYNLAQYQLPNISDQAPFNSSGAFNTTGTSQSAYTTNASELAANYNLDYTRDDQDVNTFNYYEGNSCMAQTLPGVVGNVRNVLLKHLIERKFEFAHAKRKEKITIVEKAFAKVYAMFFRYQVVYALTSWQLNSLGTATPPAPNYAQLGHLLISGNVTGAPKIFLDGGEQSYPSPALGDWNGRAFTGTIIDPNSRVELSAEALMRRFHFSSLPLTYNPEYPYNKANAAPFSDSFNQWLIYRGQEIPICCDDFDKIQNNNIIKTFDGQDARVYSLRAGWHKGIAKIDYAVNKVYTYNLLTQYIIDGITVKQQL